MDAIETFKNKANQNVAGYKTRKKKNEQNGIDIASDTIGTTDLNKYLKKNQDNTIVQQTSDATSKALESSKQQNVQQNYDAANQLNARIAQAEAQAQAQNQANQQVATTQQNTTTQNAQNTQNTNNVSNDEGWKKYYDEAFKKETEGMNFFDRLLDGGQASSRAEVRARNKYTRELMENNQNDKAKELASYNSAVAEQASKRGQAIGRTIGADASSDTYDKNKWQLNWNNIRNTFNALRTMDLGSGIVGADDTTKFEAADAGRFLVNLLPQAVPYLNVAYGATRGLPTFAESITGYGKDSDTGNYKQLDPLERIGKGVSGVIDVVAPFYGGSGDLMKTVGNKLFKETATKTVAEATKNVTTSTLKKLLKSFISEGSEEGIQQAAEFFGDGGKLITEDGQFDSDSFQNLLKETGQAAVLGGLGGSLMEAGAIGINKIDNKIKNKKTIDKVNQDLQENATMKDSDLSNLRNVTDYESDSDVKTLEDIAEDYIKVAEENIQSDDSINSEDIEQPKILNPEKASKKTDADVIINNSLDNIKSTVTSSDLFSNDIKTELSNYVDTIKAQLESNNITQEQAIKAIDDVKAQLEDVANNNQAVKQEESATGQQVNPNRILAVENAEGTQASDNVNKSIDDIIYTRPSGKEGSVQEFLNKEHPEFNLLSDDLKNKYFEGLQNRKDESGKISRLTLLMYDNVFFDNKGIKKEIRNSRINMFNSEDNQSLIKTLGIEDMVKTNYRKTSTKAGEYVEGSGVTKYGEEIKVYLQSVNSIEDIKSIEVHEASHAAWQRLSVEQRISVSNDLFQKIGIDIKADNNIAASLSMNELIAYSTEYRWEGENAFEKFGSDKTSKKHLDTIMEYAGKKNDKSLRDRIVGAVEAFTTYIKGKISGIIKVKTFDDFYNGLINGDFREDLKINNNAIYNGANSHTADYLSGRYNGGRDVSDVEISYEDYKNGVEKFYNDVIETSKKYGDQSGVNVLQSEKDAALKSINDKIEYLNNQNISENTDTYTSDANNVLEVGKKNVDKGVELAEGFVEDPQGFEKTAIENNIPIAYDYSTGQYLYFLDDVYSALDANGGIDINGVKFETPAIRQAKIADSDAKSLWEADKRWNEYLKQRRLNNEISQYDYERQLALPTNKKEIQAYGQYYDPAYIKTLGVTGDYGDPSIPPVWGNNHRGEKLDTGQIDNLIDTAKNETQTNNQKDQIDNIINTSQNDTTNTQRNKYSYDYQSTANEYGSRLKETGMTPDLLRKIYQERYDANTSGRQPNLDAVLDSNEQKIAKDFFNEVAKGSKDSGDKMYKDAYVTAQNEGTEYQNRALLELVDTGTLENIYKYYSAIVTPDNFDASGDATIDYMIRRDKPDMLIKGAAADYASEINPSATNEQIESASNDIVDAINDLNTTTKGLPENGIGDKDINDLKIADKLSDAGTKLGVEKTIIKDAPKGLSDDVRLKNLNQWYEGAYFGVFQNVNAFSNNSASDVDSFITNRLESLTDNQRQKIIDSRDSRMKYFTEMFGSEKIAEYMTNRSMLKEALQENLINYNMKTEFTNNASNKLMNEYTSRYMLQDRYTQTMAQKIASTVQRVMNSSFRGMRVATTLNELPEIFTSMADYNTFHTAKPGECAAIKAKYGMAQGGSLEQVLKTMDKTDAKAFRNDLEIAKDINQAIGVFKKWSNKIGKVANDIDSATQWNGFIQDWKDATFLKNAETYYASKGLTGTDLTMQVLSDFESRMLPMNRVYKILKSDSAIMKPLTMYVDSSLRLTRKFLKGAVGLNEVGVNKNIGRTGRIARNAALDILPRAISAMIMGVPLASVFGLFQVGGEDYSGISDEDKNGLDVAINMVGQLSPIMSLGANYYNAYRQEEIGKEQRGDDYVDNRGSWAERGTNNLLKTFTPLGNRLDQDFGIFGNINNTKDVLDRGYAENKEGRVQYLSPDNPVDYLRSLIGGVNRTSNAREYNNNPDLLSTIINQAKGQDINRDNIIDGGFGEFFTENAALNSAPFDFKLKNEEAYNRPASASTSGDYNSKIKNAETQEERDYWYQKSREYNAIKDNMRVNNKDAVDVYNASVDSDLISPKKWEMIAYDNAKDSTNNLVNLDTWHMMQEMAIKKAQDFYGDDWQNNINPQWLLDDDRASRYLQYKSTATGEDTALSRIMKTDEFWSDFFAKQKAFYNNQGESEWDNEGQSADVQRWYALDDQMNAMYDWDTNDALRLKYPLMAEYNSLKTALQSKYGNDYKSSQEYKNFWSVVDSTKYSDEMEAYNEEMRNIVNQMRKIEGVDALSKEEWETIGDIGYSSSSKNYGSSYGSSNYSYAPTFSNTFSTDPYYMQTKQKTSPKFSWSTAKKANFYDVPTSSSKGSDPYASVV